MHKKEVYDKIIRWLIVVWLIWELSKTTGVYH